MILRIEQMLYRKKPSSIVHISKLHSKGSRLSDGIEPAPLGFHEETDLPEWVRAKLAVLYMRDFDHPLEDIPGVGVRTGRYVYLIYTDDEGTDHGDDAREAS